MSSSSAECLRFETMEEGQTGTDGGIESSSLDAGLLFTGVLFGGGAGGPILATTVLLIRVVYIEFAMAQ